MTLSKFPAVMPQAAAAVIEAAEALRYIQSSTGDLRLRDIDRANDAMRAAKSLCLSALAEGQKQPAASAAFMASIGGPSSLAVFAGHLAQIDAAATAWNDAWSAWLDTLEVSELIQPATLDRDGIETRYIARTEVIGDAKAAPLRGSQALADLVAALAAVGA
ncbi:hypothetical protein [Rhodovulum strictum]